MLGRRGRPQSLGQIPGEAGGPLIAVSISSLFEVLSMGLSMFKS
jgi:hypothetical protein